MTDKTNASIDLAQLDKIKDFVLRAQRANEFVAMVPPDEMLDVLALARRSLTSGAPALESILNCYSPDDTVGDYQDKIRALYASGAE